MQKRVHTNLDTIICIHIYVLPALINFFLTLISVVIYVNSSNFAENHESTVVIIHREATATVTWCQLHFLHPIIRDSSTLRRWSLRSVFAIGVIAPRGAAPRKPGRSSGRILNRREYQATSIRRLYIRIRTLRRFIEPRAHVRLFSLSLSLGQ